MLITSNKKTMCQIDLERKKYSQHLNRLVELREGVSSQQLKRVQQQKKLIQTINKVRKIHEYNRSYRWKCMKELQQNSNDFSKVKSVLKKGIQKPLIQMASRQRKTADPLLEENQKLYERLCAVKPSLDFSVKEGHLKIKDETTAENDFSELYQNSRISQKSKKIMKIKLGSSKNNTKGIIYLDFTSLMTNIKNDHSLYLLEFVCGKAKKRTQYFQIKNAEPAQIHIKVPTKSYDIHKLSGKLIKILSGMTEKQISKSSFEVQQMQQQSSNCNNNSMRWKIDFKNQKMPRFKQTKSEHGSLKAINSHDGIMMR